MGDVDGDGTITSNDAAAAYLIAGNNGAAPEGSKFDVAAADVDGVAGVTADDAKLIMSKVLRASVVFKTPAAA